MFVNRILKRVGPAHIRAHSHCSRHKEEIERSSQCGCFYCMETFSPNQIATWHDDGETAECPKCGIDAVIGSASRYPISNRFLQRMHRYWFDRSYKIELKS
jgi:hypothetical protein